MKSLLLGILGLCLTASAAAQTSHLKFTQSGSFASLSDSTDPLSSFSLNVSTTGTNGASSASLFYQTLTIAPDFNSETFTIIVATIPGSAFTGQNTRNLTLNFDASQLDPNTSTNITCSVDLTTFEVTCGPGPTGQIQLQFQGNDLQRTQLLTQESVSTTGPVTIRTHQKSDTSSATVQGTIFGTQISSANASVGVNHSSTLEMIVSQ